MKMIKDVFFTAIIILLVLFLMLGMSQVNKHADRKQMKKDIETAQHYLKIKANELKCNRYNKHPSCKKQEH